jgi:hypothetical protein
MPISSNIEPDPKAEVRKAALELLRNDESLRRLFLEEKRKPSEWSKRTNAPYYRERFALELKHIIDEMIIEQANGEFTDRQFFYSDFPTQSQTSLYLKINQSKLYLLDNLDFEGKYARFFEGVSISRERGKGIRIGYNRDMTAVGILPSAHKVNEKSADVISWKDRMQDFLDNSEPGQELELKRLSLTNDEVQELNYQLGEIVSILFKVTNNRIWITRLTEEQISKLNS